MNWELQQIKHLKIGLFLPTTLQATVMVSGIVMILTLMEQDLILSHMMILMKVMTIAILILVCRLLNIMVQLHILKAIFGENLLMVLIQQPIYNWHLDINSTLISGSVINQVGKLWAFKVSKNILCWLSYNLSNIS